MLTLNHRHFWSDLKNLFLIKIWYFIHCDCLTMRYYEYSYNEIIRYSFYITSCIQLTNSFLFRQFLLHRSNIFVQRTATRGLRTEKSQLRSNLRETVYLKNNPKPITCTFNFFLLICNRVHCLNKKHFFFLKRCSFLGLHLPTLQ